MFPEVTCMNACQYLSKLAEVAKVPHEAPAKLTPARLSALERRRNSFRIGNANPLDIDRYHCEVQRQINNINQKMEKLSEQISRVSAS